MNYSIPDNKTFIAEVKKYFGDPLSRFGYVMRSCDDKQFNVKIIYENIPLDRRIIISNAYNYTDYGYSVFIYNTGGEESYNILVNVPFSREDRECNFLRDSYDWIMGNADLLDIISGKIWKEYTTILYQVKE